LTIASRIGEPQPRLGLARETTKKTEKPSVRDDRVLKKVCRSLEAAGLSVVVVVALDASPALASTGHTLRRVRRSLEATGLSVVGDLASGASAPAQRHASKANLALVRDGARLSGRTSNLAENEQHAGPVIVLTTADDEAAARAAFASSGFGYIVKAVADVTGASPSPLVVRSADRRQASAELQPGSSGGAVVVDYGLTSREVEVMRALATGASTVEVARELYVSPKTAKNHIAHIYAKLGVSSRTQAVAKALRQGIVSID
jgi:DNA-binding NarL/FixJ family response regulator